MRASHLFSFLFLVISTVSFAQSDWKKLELKGKVKSVEIIDYGAVEKFGEVTKKNIVHGEQYVFNENGLVIQQKNYGKLGQPISQQRYLYDDFSNQIEQNISDKDGKLQRRIVSVFNQFNHKTFETVYGSDGSLISRSVFSYEKNVQPIKIITFDGRGNETILQEYSFDRKKLTKMIKTTNPKSKTIEKALKYDVHDNLIETLVFDVEGKLATKVAYVFDDKNNLIESYYYEKDDLLVSRKLSYNHLDFLVEVKIAYPKKEKSDTLTYTYDFDEQANWVKMTEHVNSIPIKLKERKIIYY